MGQAAIKKHPSTHKMFSDCRKFYSSYRCGGTQPLYLQISSGAQPNLAAALQVLQHLWAGTCCSPLFSAAMVGCLLGLALGLQREFTGCCLEAVEASTSSCFHFRHRCNVRLCLLGTLQCNPATGILGFSLGFHDFIKGGVALKGSAVVIS